MNDNDNDSGGVIVCGKVTMIESACRILLQVN